jgi:hypothetical protein
MPDFAAAVAAAAAAAAVAAAAAQAEVLWLMAAKEKWLAGERDAWQSCVRMRGGAHTSTLQLGLGAGVHLHQHMMRQQHANAEWREQACVECEV